MWGNITFIFTLICFGIGITFIVSNFKKRKLDNGKMGLLVLCCITTGIMLTASVSLNQCGSGIDALTYELDNDFYKDEKAKQEKEKELYEARKGIKVASGGIAITLAALVVIQVAQNKAVVKKEEEQKLENALHKSWNLDEITK